MTDRISPEAYAKTLYEYDGNGNLIEITMPSGNKIIRTYDAGNLLIKKEHKELG